MRKHTQSLLLATAVAIVAAACQPDSPTTTAPDDVAQPIFSQASGGGWKNADHHVVEFGGKVSKLESAVAAGGGTLVRAHSKIGIATVAGLDDAGAAALAGAAGVQSVTRDLMVQWTPSMDALAEHQLPEGALEGHVVADPTTAFFYGCQWNMSQVDGPGAWGAGEFGAGARVAVLDTGVDPFHDDLDGRVDEGSSTSVLSPGSSPCGGTDETTFFDFGAHGSFVSGIIAGNGFGMTGIAPDATIVGVKVLNCGGSGSFGDLIAGIMYAADLSNIDVINMSLGAYFPKSATGGGQLNGALAKAVNYANSKGILVSTSAGNSGAGPGVGANLDKDKNFVHVPSQSGSAIGAWAGDVNGDLAGYSNYGRSGTWVGAGGGDGDVPPSAPLAGCVIPQDVQGLVLSVCSSFVCGGTNFYLIGDGTSFSAPLVSGVGALIDGQAGGSMNAGQLKAALKNSADDLGKKGSDAMFHHGRVNAGAAVGN